MKINWTTIYKKYKGKWVALTDDEKTVVGHGNKISEVQLQAMKKGFHDPIIMRVPENLNSYAGNF